MPNRRASDGRMRTPSERGRWTPMEDFVLEQLVGKVSYQMIALKLGRSAQAVQRRASYKGYSARRNWEQDRATRRDQLDKLQAQRLTMTESELAAYL